MVLKSDCNDIRVVSWREKKISEMKAKNYAIYNSRHESPEEGGVQKKAIVSSSIFKLN